MTVGLNFSRRRLRGKRDCQKDEVATKLAQRMEETGTVGLSQVCLLRILIRAVSLPKLPCSLGEARGFGNTLQPMPTPPPH